jgi:beta-glucosidase
VEDLSLTTIDTLAGSASTPQPEVSEATGQAARRFADDFIWGAATSSYQIEGAATEDGKGESIWDRFCATAGNIADGSTGAVACDHYHRYGEDVDLMAELGLNGYRFSISWPRILPAGTGAVNQAGLDFYDRLVDRLLAAGIRPFATLYHWDLPQAMEDAGGWPVRSVAEAFADYARIVAERLGDRVRHWATINEPYVVANHGYLTGEHAPGRSSLADSLAASHHVLLGHGLALAQIRSVDSTLQAGIVINFTPVTPVGSSPAALDRQQLVDEIENRWYIDPIAGNGYPAYATERLGWAQEEVRDGDLDLIAAPIDMLGVNFYTRKFVGALDGERSERGRETAMGWEIQPSALGSLLRSLHQRYGFDRLYITENGAAMPDEDRVDGRIADADRISYFGQHLAEVHDAIADGVPVAGYFAWSLLDNFEWAHGYVPRFGLVEVDLETQQRNPKHSGLWYSRLARSGVLPPWDALLPPSESEQ